MERLELRYKLGAERDGVQDAREKGLEHQLRSPPEKIRQEEPRRGGAGGGVDGAGQEGGGLELRLSGYGVVEERLLALGVEEVVPFGGEAFVTWLELSRLCGPL